MRYILALDEGTSSARAALYDRSARRLGMESLAVESSYPQSGWVEQDPREIWLRQREAARRLLDRLAVKAGEVAAIGITNQRESTVVWDRRTGEPVAPAIVWQCRRTAERCRSMPPAVAAEVERKTGLVVDAYFSATKIEWILEHVPGARERAGAGDLLFGTIDTWLLWQLSGGAVHATDETNASRTMLMDLRRGCWDPDLLDLFGIPRAMLPAIVPSSGVAGIAGAGHFGAAIPIAGIAGDQQAALFGQACFRPGLCKNTYGTGCFALLHTGGSAPESAHRLIATRAASTGSGAGYALEGSVFIAGAAIQWLRDRLGLLSTAAESEQLARSVRSNGGDYFVPAFVGLGAPHWDSAARGLLAGLTQASTRAHIVRAALESIAFQSRELVEAMEADSGRQLTELRVDGGAASNDFLMEFQAGILNRAVVRPADTETTALGAALLAGLAVGFWRSPEEVEQFWRVEKRFEPNLPAAEREDLYQGWREAVSRCRGRGEGAVLGR